MTRSFASDLCPTCGAEEHWALDRDGVPLVTTCANCGAAYRVLTTRENGVVQLTFERVADADHSPFDHQDDRP